MINLHKKVLGKSAFREPSYASNPADISAGPFDGKLTVKTTVKEQ
jgi:hypothetical protein